MMNFIGVLLINLEPNGSSGGFRAGCSLLVFVLLLDVC
jgi:hypothetical protein